MTALFVSDVHLSHETQSRARSLIRMLRETRARYPLTHLFLLGDIFDLWVGPGEYFYFQHFHVLNELVRFRRSGVKIFFFQGNHDIHLERFFADVLGFTVLDQPQTFLLDQHRIRVEHGDQMDPSDKGYIFLRRLLRHPFVAWLAHVLPSWWIAGFGQWASRKSRSSGDKRESVLTERMRLVHRTHMKQAHTVQGFDVAISGHVHVVDDHELSPGGPRVINLGSWLDQGRAVLARTGPDRKLAIQWLQPSAQPSLFEKK